MPIEVTCPGCGTKFKLPEKFAQRGFVCAKCQHEFRLPTVAAGPSPSPQFQHAVPAQPSTPSRLERWPAASQPAPIANRDPPRVPSPAAAPPVTQATSDVRAQRRASKDFWEELGAVEEEGGALTPRIEPRKSSKKRKVRASKKRGEESDWPYYAIGLVGFGPLLFIVQPLLIYSVLSNPSLAVRRAQTQAVVPGADANQANFQAAAPVAAAEDVQPISGLDPYVSREGQRALSIILPLWHLAMIVYLLGGVWATFAKAGRPGWAVLIPIYNGVVLFSIAEVSLWWLPTLLIPGFGLIPALVLTLNLAAKFGKGNAFGVGLALLGPIFYPVLGYGNARYQPRQTRFASDSY